MRIKQFTLSNFGVYRGLHTFELLPLNNNGNGTSKSIVLFGGKNGSGKTTLLEAFRLCLYGRLALGNAIGKKQYNDFLKQRIHRNFDGNLETKEASLEVHFDFGTMGETHDYSVTRSWSHLDNDSVDEQLQVSKDGKPLENLDPLYWDDFIEELIPTGLSELFFFDGEKIQKLAEEEDDSVFSASVKALLGLDLVDKLESDLNIFRDRQLKEQIGAVGDGKLQELETDLVAKRNEIVQVQAERADLQMRLDSSRCSIRDLETKFTRIGGKLANDRENLLGRKGEITSAINSTEKRIRELTESCLPFAFCPTLMKVVLKQFSAEEQLFKDGGIRNVVAKAFNSTNFRLKKERGVSEKLSKLVLSIFTQEIERQLPPIRVKKVQNYSRDLHDLLVYWFEQSDKEAQELRELCKSLEHLIRELRQVEQKLKQIPDDELLKPSFEGLTGKYKETAMLEQALSAKDEQLSLFQREDAQLQRELERHKEHLLRSGKIGVRLDLIEKSKKALVEYQLQLTKLKVQTLEREIADCFKKLMRKEDLIQQIRVIPETFNIQLFNKSGELLSKRELSAGEKQMYAIAVLWGLARASGRSMPIIIDTPLGRLDSEHRRLLMKNYFPYVSHQTIILSTDTEIDQVLFETLRSNIARAYHLIYDSSSGSVKPESGYFWGKELAYA